MKQKIYQINEERRKDYISHFILRLAFARRFVNKELQEKASYHKSNPITFFIEKKYLIITFIFTTVKTIFLNVIILHILKLIIIKN